MKEALLINPQPQERFHYYKAKTLLVGFYELEKTLNQLGDIYGFKNLIVRVSDPSQVPSRKKLPQEKKPLDIIEPLSQKLETLWVIFNQNHQDKLLKYK